MPKPTKQIDLVQEYGASMAHPVTITYGLLEVWPSRMAAEDAFLEAMASSEGAERNRYFNVYWKLKDGLLVCSDDEGRCA